MNATIDDFPPLSYYLSGGITATTWLDLMQWVHNHPGLFPEDITAEDLIEALVTEALK
jgi:hypothetical protein